MSAPVCIFMACQSVGPSNGGNSCSKCCLFP